MGMLEELEKMIRTNPQCKKLFGIGKDLVRVTFQEPDVVQDFPTRFSLIYHNVAAVFKYFTEAADKDMKFDCHAGCNYCCHMRVAVSPLEVFVLSQYITDIFTEPHVNTLKKKLSDHVKRISEKSSAEHTALKMPCALLDESGKCSVYDKRPFSCRRWLSYEVESCKAAFASHSGNGIVPLNAFIFALGTGVEDELLEQLERLNLDNNYYELQSALLYALENKTAKVDWCAGRKVFQNCIPFE